MIKFLPIAVISSVSFISSCASMSPQECQTANWKQIGERDGQSGRSSRIASHHKACSKVNIAPNQNLYNFGYKKGQKIYCQPENIYENALKGAGSYRVCPLELQSELRLFYDIPNQFYQAKKNRDKFFDELDRYQDYLLDKKLSLEKRDQYIEKIHQLKKDQYKIERDYIDAERELNHFERRNNL